MVSERDESKPPVVDLERFLRIGNRTSGGSERRQRVVSRQVEQEEEHKKNTEETAETDTQPAQEADRYYEEPRRRVKVAADVDILVVGGGCAGIAAAVAAKKANPRLDVLLVEREEYLGGTISRVGMESVSWWQYNDAVKSEGLVEELEVLAKGIEGATSTFPYNDGLNLTAEPFKRVADIFVNKYGVRCLFGTLVCDTILQPEPASLSSNGHGQAQAQATAPRDSRLTGVIIENVAGRQVIWSKRAIDCSGNADVLHRAGGRFTLLPDYQRMGITQVFSVSNVDKETFLEYTERKGATYENWGNDGVMEASSNGDGDGVLAVDGDDVDNGWKQETYEGEAKLRTPYLEREFKEAEQKGVLPKGSNVNGSWSTVTQQGELLNLNLVHLQGDALDPWDVSRIAQRGREKVGEALAALKTIPGCEQAQLRTYSNNLGVRDSRKCLGRYQLTGEDVLKGARFAEESVCVLPQIVDGYGVLVLGSDGGQVEVPLAAFQCDVENLVVAGRCMSGDHVSHCLTRNIKCCMLTGQSAGVIAATSLRTGVPVGKLLSSEVRDDMERIGLRHSVAEE